MQKEAGTIHKRPLSSLSEDVLICVVTLLHALCARSASNLCQTCRDLYDAGKSAKLYTVKLSAFRGATTVAAGRLVDCYNKHQYIGLLHPIRLPESYILNTVEDGLFFQSLKDLTNRQGHFCCEGGRFAKLYFSRALFGPFGDEKPPHFSYKMPTHAEHVELRLGRICSSLVVESKSCLKSGGDNTPVAIEGKLVWWLGANDKISSVSVVFTATLTKRRTAPSGPRDNNEFDRWVDIDDFIVKDLRLRVPTELSTQTDARGC